MGTTLEGKNQLSPPRAEAKDQTRDLRAKCQIRSAVTCDMRRAQTTATKCNGAKVKKRVQVLIPDPVTASDKS